MPRLSVNINKVALLRNSRGGNLPDVLQFALDCERFGAEGITVHPRPDERHIRYSDVYALKEILTTEFNIEGNPTERFLNMVREVQPAQVTLVPDEPNQLTSDHGWDTIKFKNFLKEIISELKSHGIRTSIFVDPDIKIIENAADTGTDRIELYTEMYARKYPHSPEEAIKAYKNAAQKACELGLGVNAGHDLNLKNLRYFSSQIPHLLEVSIGHALICDALYLGLENTIQLYLKELKNF